MTIVTALWHSFGQLILPNGWSFALTNVEPFLALWAASITTHRKQWSFCCYPTVLTLNKGCGTILFLKFGTLKLMKGWKEEAKCQICALRHWWGEPCIVAGLTWYILWWKAISWLQWKRECISHSSFPLANHKSYDPSNTNERLGKTGLSGNFPVLPLKSYNLLYCQCYKRTDLIHFA